jgi:UDP-glucose 4-epimerase
MRQKSQFYVQDEKPMTLRRILVTGGAGFVGANLVRALLERNYQVSVLDNLSAGRHEYVSGLPIEFIEGDILDRETVDSAVAGCAGIIHLAAQTGVPGSLRDPRKDCQVNVFGTLNLLEACRTEKARAERVKNGTAGNELRGPRFVFASSNAPLGRQDPPATEDKAPLPISPYGASKLAGEAYCLAYYGSWQLRTVVLRFGNVYGPFSAHKGSVVAKFCRDVIAGGLCTVDGDGEQTRDFIYVGDLCHAILLALESSVSGEVFQIATGVETGIRMLATLAQGVAGQNIRVRHGPPRVGDIRRNYSTISKAREWLHWEPRVDLAIGLSETWHWFRDHLATNDQPVAAQPTVNPK